MKKLAKVFATVLLATQPLITATSSVYALEKKNSVTATELEQSAPNQGEENSTSAIDLPTDNEATSEKTAQTSKQTDNSSQEINQDNKNSIPEATLKTENSTADKTITISVERFVLGQGYIVEPIQANVSVTMKNYAAVLDNTLKQNGYNYDNTGSITNSFYLSSIANADNGKLNIPTKIQEFANQSGLDLSNASTNEFAPELSEFSYTNMSGWMYSINNQFPARSMSDTTPKSGDVFRVQFSVAGFGTDLGGGLGAENPLAIADKTELTRKIGEININKEAWLTQGAVYQQTYQQAYKVLENAVSSQSEVDEALKNLNEVKVPTDPAVDKVIKLIKELGEITTVEQKQQVEAARSAYNQLSAKQQADIDNETLSLLEKAEAKIQELIDESGIQKVIETINQLPAVNQLTLQDQAKVVAAQQAYEKLSTTQQAKVTNIEKLTTAIAKIKEIIASLNIEAGLQQASTYMLKDGKINSDWDSLALARSGYPANEKQRQTYYNQLIDDINKTLTGKRVSLTDLEHQLIAIMSVGGDPVDFDNQNIIQKLTDSDFSKAGINGVIFGLLALNMDDYAVKNKDKKVQELVDYILSKQLSDGGWALFGSKSDIDVTGMALTALATENNNAEVAVAVNRAIDYLNTTLTPEKDFFVASTWSKEPNSNTQAQAILGLASNGVDLTGEKYTDSYGMNPITRLLQYQLPTGGFLWMMSQPKENSMATNQSVHALAQFKMQQKNQGTIYNFKANPVPLLPLAEANRQVKVVIEQISALPTIDAVKLTDQTAVTKAEQAYQALSKEQQVKVTNKAKLDQLIAKLAELNKVSDVAESLKKATDQMLADQKINGEWEALALARSGFPASDEIRQAYYEKLANQIKTTNGNYRAWTDAERQMIGVIALGGDVTNVSEINLPDLLMKADLSKETINNAIFGLIALSTNDYNYTPEQKAHLKAIAEQIVAKQNVIDGGWALFGTASDIDITGMALTALSLYSDDVEIKSAINRGIAFLEQQLTENQDFFKPSMFSKEPNSNSQAQAILGLISNGVDLTSATYTNQYGVNPITRLIQYQLPSGGFCWQMSMPSENGMATEQSVHALSQFQMFQNKQGWLYDFKTNPVPQLTSIEDQKVANKVIKQIQELPSIESIDFKHQQAVTDVKSAYDQLTKVQQSKVTNTEKLTELINQLTIKNQALNSEQALEQASGKMLSNGNISSDWDALALARSGFPANDKIRQAYYEKVVTNLTKTLDDPKASLTDLERQIIAIVSVGGNPLDINGINAIERLVNSDIQKGALNGSIYGLIALSLDDYQISGKKEKIEATLDYVLSKQLSDGGWAFFGSAGDIDMTGMTLTALAPFADEEKVKIAVTKGINFLNQALTTEGDFFIKSPWSKAPNSNSQAQAIIGLASNGVDLTSDTYTKLYGANPIKRLLQYQLPNGGFRWLHDDQNENGMATNQAVHALAQVKMQQENQGTIYDFHNNPVPLLTSVEDQAKADQVSKAIQALPEVKAVQLSDEPTVQQVRTAYENLTANQKAKVTKLVVEKLVSVEKALEELKIADATDQAKADQVSKAIQALPAINKISLADENLIVSVNKQYQELTDNQKNRIAPKLADQLTSSVKRLDELKQNQVSVNQIMAETKGYMLQLLAKTEPQFNTEWPILGLARQELVVDDSLYDVYYRNVVEHVKNKKGILSKSKYTEYSRLTLAVTAIGKDARNIGGYNMFDKLSDFKKTTMQGVNGAIFALIAVDSHPDYKFTQPDDVKNQDWTTREKLIEYILNNQLKSGEFSLTGQPSSFNVDITAMALQSLAPYQEQTKVKLATNKALTYLSNIQNSQGSFGPEKQQNLESIAQVLTALTALGIDPLTDSRFIKQNKTVLDALKQFHVSGSGFMHVLPGGDNNGGAKPGEVNGMSTEQGFYSLVAYQRFVNGQNSLYNMSDVAGSSDLTEAKKVEQLIKKLGKISSLSQKPAVVAARKAYDALTTIQKSLIAKSVLNELVTAEATIKELAEKATEVEKEQEEQKQQEEKAINHVTDLINQLPNQLTLKDQNQLNTAIEAYNSLTPEQRAKIKNSDKLNSAKTSMEKMKANDKKTNKQANKKSDSWSFDGKEYQPHSKQSANTKTNQKIPQTDESNWTHLFYAALGAMIISILGFALVRYRQKI